MIEERALQSRYFSKVRYRDPYDPVVNAYADPKIDFIRRHVPIEGHILDVGCGNGIFTRRLARMGAEVVGMDFSAHLLGCNPHRPLICGDAVRLPFLDSVFDIVFVANVLHHVTDREQVVGEMARVSRKYLMLLEPNRYNPIMFAFSLLVRPERGVLKSCASRLEREVSRAGMSVRVCTSTGMISQNNTPAFVVPLLKRFDRDIWYGEYILLLAEKR